MSSNSLESWALNQVSIVKGTHALDITSLVQTLIVEEDIEKGFARGSLAFIDSMNLMETMEMTGDEFLFVNFNSFKPDLTEKDPYSKIFQINGYMELSEQSLGTKRGIQLEFVTPGEIKNEYQYVSKSYSNTSNSSIVKEMIDLLEVDDTINIEETLFMKDLIIPNITPLEAISFLGRYSMSKENGDSNFYFFENRYGINFVSGTTLSKQEPFEYIIEGSNPKDLQMYKKVSNFQRVKGYDLLEAARSGSLGENVAMRDALHRGYQIQSIDAEEINQDFPVLNNIPVLSIKPDVQFGRTEFISTEQMYQFNNKSSYGNMKAIRDIKRGQMSQKRAFMEAGGDSDVCAGMLVDLKIINQIGQASARDSGKWLIAKCRHIINVNAGRYTQEFDLISDSNIIRESHNVSGT